MNLHTINSLDALRRRKRKIKKEITMYEEDIMDKVDELTHPFTALFSSSTTSEEFDEYEGEISFPFKKGYKIAANVVKFVQIFKIGRSIYMDFKK